MVNRISNSSADACIRQRFAELPDVEKGDAHVIKKGESLWVIAQNELGKSAKKQEVNDYMFQLAKLNGLDTHEKMNNIRQNDTIYLIGKNKTVQKPVDKPVPKSVNRGTTAPQSADEKPQNVQLQRSGANTSSNPFSMPNYFELYKPESWTPKSLSELTEKKDISPQVRQVQPQQVSKPKPKPEVKPRPAVTPKPKNTGEAVFTDRLNTVLNDNTVIVKKSDLHLISGDQMYHMSKKEPFGSRGAIVQRALMSVTLSEQGKLKNISFEGYENINPYGYDYEVVIDKKDKGTLYEKSYSSCLDKKCGSVDKSEIQQLQKRMDKVVKK